MATGYEIQMYHNLSNSTEALKSIAKSLERIAAALEKSDAQEDAA